MEREGGGAHGASVRTILSLRPRGKRGGGGLAPPRKGGENDYVS